MTEELRSKLAKVAIGLVEGGSERELYKESLHAYFWGDEDEREMRLDVLMTLFKQALDNKDIPMLEYMGRNVPKRDSQVGSCSQKAKIAAYILTCLMNFNVDGKRRPIEEAVLPKRKEVSQRLNLPLRRVEEFYQELAEVSELDLDERRVKTNVWS